MRTNVGRIAATGAIAVMTLAALTGTAWAQYEGDDDFVESSSNVCPVGTTCTFSAGIFLPGSTVEWFFASHAEGHIATDVANEDGVSTIDFTIPEGTEPGRHTVTARGVDPNGEPFAVATEITVPAAEARQPPGLARTGSSSTFPLVRGALVLTAVGAGLVLTSRRRSTRASSRA